MKFTIKNLSSTLIVRVFSILFFNYTYGQLSVFEANTNDEQVAAIQSLIGEGVQILNVSVDCGVDGIGTFSNTGSNLGIEQGMMLTSGEVALAVPGSSSITGGDGNGGDPQLSALAGFNTFDKCIVEFDLIPAGDNVDFQYVWGSYEYQSYTCSSFNDIFAFFVSGPDPSGGPDYNEVNIALVPGTDVPVAIGTVNNGSGMNGTPCTDPFTGGNCPCNSDLFVPNSNQVDVAYYGFTNVLTAHFNTVACGIYHIKIAVADVSDSALDSGVLINANSLNSINQNSNPQISVSSLSVCVGEALIVTCNLDNSIDSYSWIFTNTITGDTIVSTLLNPNFQPETPGLYQLSLTTNRCSNQVVDEYAYPELINVNYDIPTLELITVEPTMGQEITLSCNYSVGEFAWEGNGLVNNGSSTVQAIPNELINVYTLTYTNPDGCVTTGQITVDFTTGIASLQNGITIHNILMMDANSPNQYWNLSWLSAYPKHKVELYNLNGSLVYTSSDYRNQFNGMINGKPLPMGNYIYRITYGDEMIYNHSGLLTLLR